MNPGPGNYDPNIKVTKLTAPQYQIGGHTERMNVVSKDAQTLPGPDAYEKETLIGGSQSIHYSIAAKNDHSFDNRVPGPGQYDPRDHLTVKTSPVRVNFSKSARPEAVS
jgi:hypothetical protein